MNFRIPYLDTFLAMGILSLPIGAGVNLSYFIQTAVKRKSIFIDYIGMIISYAAVLLAAALLGAFHPEQLVFRTKLYWYIVSPVAGAVATLLEYALGALIISLSAGKRTVPSVRVHSVYTSRDKVNAADIAAITVFVILEELIFRSALVQLLSDIGLSLLAAVLISAGIFALNHINMGLKSSCGKLLSGAIYASLYGASGCCILIPVTAHLCQNLILLVISRIERERSRIVDE